MRYYRRRKLKSVTISVMLSVKTTKPDKQFDFMSRLHIPDGPTFGEVVNRLVVGVVRWLLFEAEER